jgi:hypothetical protein
MHSRTMQTQPPYKLVHEEPERDFVRYSKTYNEYLEQLEDTAASEETSTPPKPFVSYNIPHFNGYDVPYKNFSKICACLLGELFFTLIPMPITMQEFEQLILEILVLASPMWISNMIEMKLTKKLLDVKDVDCFAPRISEQADILWETIQQDLKQIINRYAKVDNPDYKHINTLNEIRDLSFQDFINTAPLCDPLYQYQYITILKPGVNIFVSPTVLHIQNKQAEVDLYLELVHLADGNIMPNSPQHQLLQELNSLAAVITTMMTKMTSENPDARNITDELAKIEQHMIFGKIIYNTGLKNELLSIPKHHIAECNGEYAKRFISGFLGEKKLNISSMKLVIEKLAKHRTPQNQAYYYHALAMLMFSRGMQVKMLYTESQRNKWPDLVPWVYKSNIVKNVAPEQFDTIMENASKLMECNASSNMTIEQLSDMLVNMAKMHTPLPLFVNQSLAHNLVDNKTHLNNTPKCLDEYARIQREKIAHHAGIAIKLPTRDTCILIHCKLDLASLESTFIVMDPNPIRKNIKAKVMFAKTGAGLYRALQSYLVLQPYQSFQAAFIGLNPNLGQFAESQTTLQHVLQGSSFKTLVNSMSKYNYQ